LLCFLHLFPLAHDKYTKIDFIYYKVETYQANIFFIIFDYVFQRIAL
jgi:hypothetical protein